MQRFFRAAMGILVMILLGTACAQTGVHENPDALYYRMGGKEAMAKLVTDTVEYWHQDKRLIEDQALRDKIAATDVKALRHNLFSFLCSTTNGPCSFDQSRMQDTLRGLRISPIQWYYMLEGIVATLNKHNIPLREQNEIMEIVYGLRN